MIAHAAALAPRSHFAWTTRANAAWLGLSGVTTTVSWIFDFEALKQGEVSTVALIDKGSFDVAVVQAWLSSWARRSRPESSLAAD